MSTLLFWPITLLFGSSLQPQILQMGNSWQKYVLWSQMKCCCPLLWDLHQSTTKSKHEFCWLLDILPRDKHQNAHECISNTSEMIPADVPSSVHWHQNFPEKKLPSVELAAVLLCNVFSFLFSRLEHPKAGRKDVSKNQCRKLKAGPYKCCSLNTK